MNPRVLPESFLRLMSPADRKPMGKAGLTLEEVHASQEKVSEREIQNLCAQYCNLREVFYIRNRMDRKPTCQTGIPDLMLTLPGERTLAVEVKTLKGKTSETQDWMHQRYHDQTGGKVKIVHSFQEFKTLLDAELAKWEGK